LRQETGCGTELNYAEQSSWFLFLKYLDDKRAMTGDDLVEYVNRELWPIFSVRHGRTI